MLHGFKVLNEEVLHEVSNDCAPTQSDEVPEGEVEDDTAFQQSEVQPLVFVGRVVEVLPKCTFGK